MAPAAGVLRRAQRRGPEQGSGLAPRLYKDALAIRRQRPELGDGPMDWLVNDENDVLEFSRSDEFVCVVNFGSTTATLPPHRTVLLASAEITGDVLPANSSAWLEI